MTPARHCEERSDEAIQKGGTVRLDCFASLAMTGTVAAFLVVTFTASLAGAAEIPLAERRSGFDLMSPETQAMQRDDTANPGMLWVGEGEALWNRKAGSADRACADCHGDAAVSMRGVAARYPAFNAERRAPIDLQGQINLCRERRQNATPFRWESQELLALTTYVAHQSRGLAVVAADDERLIPFREQGRARFHERQGQLNFSCGNCHDDNWGRRLAGNVIPQAHPTGYPIYRLEWQGMGSLQRRLRNCMTGVRAEPYPYGAPEWVELELYLNWRARGLPVETPGVRP
jgi:L-cysteine S-thiosulfotransferase